MRGRSRLLKKTVFAVGKYQLHHETAMFPSRPINAITGQIALIKRRMSHALTQGRLLPGERLVREFLEDALYNPRYGYFATHAPIMHRKVDLDCTKFKSLNEWEDAIADAYTSPQTNQLLPNARPAWHTPTELFTVCSVISIVL